MGMIESQQEAQARQLGVVMKMLFTEAGGVSVLGRLGLPANRIVRSGS